MLDLQSSTLVFQILNFFILLAGLSYFLYRPLLKVMREREEGISARLREAEEKTKEAAAAQTRLAAAEQQLKQDAAETLARAQSEAATEARRLLDDAKRAAVEEEERARQQVSAEERAALARLRSQTAGAAVAMARELIGAVAGEAVHRALLETFLSGDLGIDREVAESLRQASTRFAGFVVVEVAYQASSDLAQRFATTLTRVVGVPFDAGAIQFRVNPELVAGARVLLGTLAIDLSLSRVLTQAEQRILAAPFGAARDGLPSPGAVPKSDGSDTHAPGAVAEAPR